jgi:hypothetical protein
MITNGFNLYDLDRYQRLSMTGHKRSALHPPIGGILLYLQVELVCIIGLGGGAAQSATKPSGKPKKVKLEVMRSGSEPDGTVLLRTVGFFSCRFQKD